MSNSFLFRALGGLFNFTPAVLKTDMDETMQTVALVPLPVTIASFLFPLSIRVQLSNRVLLSIRVPFSSPSTQNLEYTIVYFRPPSSLSEMSLRFHRNSASLRLSRSLVFFIGVRA